MVTQTTTSNIRYIGGDPENDGVSLGKDTSSKVSFYGATPIVRPTLTLVTTATATTALNETRLGRIETILINLGLVTSA